jgi:hypothetical protein
MKSWLVLLGAFCLSACVQAQKVYSVGVEAFPYYPHYQTTGDTFGGYARDILDAFSQVSGHKLRYHPMPYMRIVNLFLSNKLDFQYPDNEYWLAKRKKSHKIFYSESAVDYTDGIHLLPNNQGKGINEIKIIGTLLGFTPIQYFPLQESGQLQIHYSSTVNGLIKQAHLGRIDGVYLNTDVIRYAERHKSTQLIFDDSLPHIQSGYSLSSINHPDIIEAFNQFLINNQPLINNIKQKYQLH